MGTGGSGTGGTLAPPVDGSSGDASDATDVLDLCADAGNDSGPGDQDFDGTPDCLDRCPLDPGKTAPGLCGCGTLDTDTDSDGFPDCMDTCPRDPVRHVAGACGCNGVPDATPLCLIHRYSFNDTTATIADSITITGVSPANGTAVGTVPAGGRIVLAGGGSTQIGGQYVSLPAGTISTLGNNATFEAWVTWNPVVGTTDGFWQRVFDFGSSNQGAGTPGMGVTYIFMTPSNSANQRARAAITLAGGGSNEDLTDATGSLPTARQVHVAVVVDGTNQLMTLYIDGTTSVSSVALRDKALLSHLDDVNNWIGRSQWSADQLFAGMISEVRIYGKALSQAEVSASFAAGPDTLFTPVDAGTGDGGPSADGGVTDSGSSADSGGDVPVGG
jgi:hypothetical protein